jgi:hypothetical protein
MSATVITEPAPTEPAAVAGRPVKRSHQEFWAATIAGLLAMGTYCLADKASGIYPFGPRSRAVNDLANQFVPFHAHLWDLEHSAAAGDLYFNWSSGYGVPFLPDFFSYLMNPFSGLVGFSHVIWSICRRFWSRCSASGSVPRS